MKPKRERIQFAMPDDISWLIAKLGEQARQRYAARANDKEG